MLRFPLEISRGLLYYIFMVYITGDIHAALDSERQAFFQSLSKDDILIVLGDFGYSWNEDMLKHRWAPLNIQCITLSVLGNHENYSLINSRALKRVFGANTRELAPNTYYIMNGEICDIEGIKMFVFGGAKSIDQDFRKPWISWWPEEIPSQGEFLKGLDNLKKNNWDIDLFLGHTCPADVASSLFNYPYKINDPVETMLSQYECEIQENNPGKGYPFLFGHHHTFKWGSKYICLYNQVLSVQKKDGKMILERVI